MIVIGLTGSIGMGKTTVAELFKNFNVKIINDDSIAKSIMSKKRVKQKIAKLIPEVIQNNKYDSKKLREILINNQEKLKIVEGIVHPLVKKKIKYYLFKISLINPFKIILIDSALLFEMKLNLLCDYIITVNTSYKTQEERVLSRPNMTLNNLKNILKNQLPNSYKIKNSDYIINTEKDIKFINNDIINILNNINNKRCKLVKYLINNKNYE